MMRTDWKDRYLTTANLSAAEDESLKKLTSPLFASL